MDKKNTFIGILLIIGAIASLYIGQKYSPQPQNPAAVRQAVSRELPPAPAGPPSITAEGSGAVFASAAGDGKGARITVLENDHIQVRFTDFGGAIRDVALKEYPEEIHDSSPFVFNRLHADPMLAFTDVPGLDRTARFELVSTSASEIVYRAVWDGRIEVTRRYTLPPDKEETTDPYQLRTETVFRNISGGDITPIRVSIALGTAETVNPLDNGRFLTTGYSNGKGQTFIPRSKLEESGGFLGMGAHSAVSSVESAGPVAWAAVSNQFFTTILTPDKPGAEIVTRRVKVRPALADADRTAYGITATAQFDLPALAPNATAALAASLYVGPKEYHRLSNSDIFRADQDKVMQFGTFKFFSAILVTLMTWIHTFIPNWGLAIVCTTLALKVLFMPLTLASARSARRMQKLQPELKVLNEKFKDNPQKKQAATMELFKQHKVNPMGGCIPILITLPFFWGFFTMLQSTADLRFAPFLWAHDLSAPDTVGHVFGIAINIFPLLLGLTSFLQMRITPQPTTDTAQARMMMFTPVIFLIFCYSFSCALSLYSTTNGLFSIVQQLVINRRMKDEPGLGSSPAAAGGKPMKAVGAQRRK